MSFIDAFLNVLAIIGIIIAGGFLVFFLGDLLLSILEPKHKTVYKEKNCDKNDFYETKTNTQENQQKFTMEDEPISQISEEKFVMDDEEIKPVDYDEARKEEKSLDFKGFDDFKMPSNIMQPQKEKKTSSDDLNNLFNDEDFDFGEDFDFDNLFEDEKQTTEVKAIEQNTTMGDNEPENVETQRIEPIKETIVEPIAEKIENNFAEVLVDNSENESALLAEIAVLRKELDEQKALYEELKSQAKHNQEKWENEKSDLEKLFSEHEVVEEEKSKPLLSLEEYVNRLNILKERLKANEKELKLNKKEFLPLKRVRNNLDNDKNKLRRREALVAKQKVKLYGVNNIMEIDQEKAKKLAEDLDLLDGLKLSVRHCEEVMESNKERYPILETTNRILITSNQDLKNDIAECEKSIAKLKTENGIGDDSDALLANATVALNKIDNTEVFVSADGENINIPAKRGRGRPRKEPVFETLEKQTITETTKTENVRTVKNPVNTENINMFEEFNLDDDQIFEDLVGKKDENKNKPTDNE